MRSTSDAVLVSNASATAGPFRLSGGTYGVAATATWSAGSVDIQILGPDGTTKVSVLAAAFSANGYKTFTVPVCDVYVVIATSTAVYAEIKRVPGE